MPPIVPPIKCQGIKTKLAAAIRAGVQGPIEGRWIEPFCGSCVVALNVLPRRALLADTNRHIIRFYRDIQQGHVTHQLVEEFLESEAESLRIGGEEYYYEVRGRFNRNPNSLDFLFLSRACFNGVMRFNQKGYFNVPFCHKPNRFARPYITKIVNQVKSFARVLQMTEWQFETADFRTTLAKVREGDYVYADPPYVGRYADYYNSWNERDELDLIALLKRLPGRFLLSTWHSNEFRNNVAIEQHWKVPGIHIYTAEHFYHVGATEDLRHSMKEAFIANYGLDQIGSTAEDTEGHRGIVNFMGKA